MKQSVTICAVDCRCPTLAIRAIELTKMHVPHDRAVIFTDDPFFDYPDIIHIKRIDRIKEYSGFIIRSLHKHIDTSHVMIVQWDGYSISNQWQACFLDYDYIGAVWSYLNDNYRVGNGGFSLRSIKLLKAASEILGDNEINEGEDYYICRTARAALERRYDIQFAPEHVANRFSYENTRPTNPTLGFHGIWNIYNHEDDASIRNIVHQCPPQQLLSNGFVFLMIKCLARERYEAFAALYAALESADGGSYLREMLQGSMGMNPKRVEEIKRAALRYAVD